MSKKVDNAMNLYLEGIRDGHYVEAVNKYTGARYTQHSTGVRDGKEGFIEFFGPFVERNPDRDIRIIRKLEEGKNVFLQAYQSLNGGEAEWVTTDFFDTDEEERIIEHWDVIAPFCSETVSGRTSVDGPTEVTDLDKTEENKALIGNLIKDAYMAGGDRDNLDQFVSREQFIQHNKEAEDGVDAFARTVKEGKLRYQQIVLMVGQGNFVATLSRAFLKEDDGERELCQVDLFRIEKGRAVEHWDNAEPVTDDDANSGKF